MLQFFSWSASYTVYDLHPNPHQLSRALGSDCKKEITYTSGPNEYPHKGVWALPQWWVRYSARWSRATTPLCGASWGDSGIWLGCLLGTFLLRFSRLSRLWGKPRNCLRDYISFLAWENLVIPHDEKTVVERDIWNTLQCDISSLSPEKWKKAEGWMHLPSCVLIWIF